jgi:hypothetical protein
MGDLTRLTKAVIQGDLSRSGLSWTKTANSFTSETKQAQQLFITPHLEDIARLSSYCWTTARKLTKRMASSALRRQVGQSSICESEAGSLPSNLTTLPTPSSTEMLSGSHDF